MHREPDPWVKKEKRHQTNMLERALIQGQVIASERILTVRAFGWDSLVRLRPQTDDRLDEEHKRFFLLCFKGPVRVGRLREVLQETFGNMRLEDLR